MSKKLGQHFLINQSAIKKIIAGLNLQTKETVIEIGPGKGALTFPLAKECEKLGCKFITIEKDRMLAAELIKRKIKNLEIINDDALKALNNQLTSQLKNYKIVGNIPYYITGKLLRNLSELENKPSLTVLMLQKEVAERAAANPPEMNLLAAAVQFWADPEILFSLESKDFSPAPEVDSAVIKLESRIMNYESGISNNYYKMIKIIFKQPRKTLFNNLKSGLPLTGKEIENSLKKLEIDPQSRPQNLSIKNIGDLASILKI